jgi:hypothetical protein
VATSEQSDRCHGKDQSLVRIRTRLKMNDPPHCSPRCWGFAKFLAWFRAMELWLLSGAPLAVCFLTISICGCAGTMPVRENYYESAAAISVPASRIPLSDLPIPSSFGKSACYPSQSSFRSEGRESPGYCSNNFYRGYGPYPQTDLFGGYAPAHDAWSASTRGRTSYGQGGFLPLVPGTIVVPPETTGPIPSTSPMLTPPQGSMAMPGGGFYPMR